MITEQNMQWKPLRWQDDEWVCSAASKLLTFVVDLNVCNWRRRAETRVVRYDSDQILTHAHTHSSTGNMSQLTTATTCLTTLYCIHDTNMAIVDSKLRPSIASSVAPSTVSTVCLSSSLWLSSALVTCVIAKIYTCTPQTAMVEAAMITSAAR